MGLDEAPEELVRTDADTGLHWVCFDKGQGTFKVFAGEGTCMIISEEQSVSVKAHPLTPTATQAALHTGRPVELYLFIYPTGKASA